MRSSSRLPNRRTSGHVVHKTQRRERNGRTPQKRRSRRSARMSANGEPQQHTQSGMDRAATELFRPSGPCTRGRSESSLRVTSPNWLYFVRLPRNLLIFRPRFLKKASCRWCWPRLARDFHRNPQSAVPNSNSSCFHGHRSFVSLTLFSGSLGHPLASPEDVGACRTPRPPFDFLGHGLPFMSICASPFENCSLIKICLGQAHSASVCCKFLKKRQAKPLVAGTYRTPSALDDVGGQCLPTVSKLTFPAQFDFAARVF